MSEQWGKRKLSSGSDKWLIFENEGDRRDIAIVWGEDVANKILAFAALLEACEAMTNPKRTDCNDRKCGECSWCKTLKAIKAAKQ